MKKIKICLIAFLSVLLFGSCSLDLNRSNNSDEYISDDSCWNTDYDWEVNGKSTASELITNIKSGNINSVKSLFSNRVISVETIDNDISQLIAFFKDASDSVQYDFSSESTTFEDGVVNYYDECSAFINNRNTIYSLYFLLSKENNNQLDNGIVTLIVSKVSNDEKSLSEKNKRFITEKFEFAENFRKEGYGVFWYKKE